MAVGLFRLWLRALLLWPLYWLSARACPAVGQVWVGRGVARLYVLPPEFDNPLRQVVYPVSTERPYRKAQFKVWRLTLAEFHSLRRRGRYGLSNINWQEHFNELPPCNA